MDETRRLVQQNLYKEFILNCTNNIKSLKNYIDFKRINECLQQLFPEQKDISILDFDDAAIFETVVNQLEKQKAYIEYNDKGKNQYSTTIAWYQRFLNAKSLFSKHKEVALAIKKETNLQQIYFGAPGTGKSHCIKEQTKGKLVIRTTFHPDSDYSTFVGAYKPTTQAIPIYSTYGKKAVEVKDADGKPMTEDRIVYEFVEQAFLQAYIKAWELYADAEDRDADKEVYLIIEEINRGNCAQIFGDLFQLLDRDDDGFSEYPITADKDLQKLLAKAFAETSISNVPAVCGMSAEEVAEKIKKGEILLLLPNNLYIYGRP